MRTAAHEKNIELEQIYQENDKLKTRIAEICLKYDFEAIDKSEKTLANLEDWAFRSKQWIFGFVSDLKQQFKCRLCNGAAQSLTTIKCGHVFCWECIRRQDTMEQCQVCGVEKADMRLNKFASAIQESLSEIYKSYEDFDKQYRHIIKEMPLRFQNKY